MTVAYPRKLSCFTGIWQSLWTRFHPGLLRALERAETYRESVSFVGGWASVRAEVQSLASWAPWAWPGVPESELALEPAQVDSRVS